MENKLYYNSYANKWSEGFPISNGRLAAMLWGDMETDIISLNHEWLWSADHRYRNSPDVSKHLDEVRRFLKKGDFFKASSLTNTYFAGEGSKFADSDNFIDRYLPAGDLRVRLKDCQEYLKRELNISKGIASSKRKCNDAVVNFKSIAHPVYNNIICCYSTDAGVFSSDLDYTRIEDLNAFEDCKYLTDSIEYSCTLKSNISHKTVIKIDSDGGVVNNSNSISINNATYINLYINIGVSVKGIEDELQKFIVPNIDIKEIFTLHAQTFEEKLCNISLNIDSPVQNLPTDERLERIKSGKQDEGMAVLLFNYGRYLLVSSSLSCDLPANLQGKWNNMLFPPWHCDYHLDINLQINYWMSEATNMKECSERLLEFIESLVPHAQKTAKALYGCRGIYMPLATDAWARTTPESIGCAGGWVGAAPWLAQHFWWHYEYNGDLDFLRNRAYPYFAEVCRFFEDYLVKDEYGIYQVMPSLSPENKFKGTGMWSISIGISCAMDVQLIYDVISYAQKTADILGIKNEEIEKWIEIRDNLPEFKIGNDGRLLEWDIEREEVELGHRHFSHLYGLFPSELFNPIDRPDQYEAAIKSVNCRADNGCAIGGWTCAWLACLFARLGQGERAYEYINQIITDYTLSNLLGIIVMAETCYQIDGSLGIVESITQCFLQSFAGKVYLLRALPSKWPKGEIVGFKTKGGHKVSFRWSDSKLDELKIELGFSGKIVLADLAGRLTMPDMSYIDNNDIVVEGKKGSVVTLKSIN